MPVKKIKTETPSSVSAEEAHVCVPESNEFGRKILWTIFGILLAYLVIYVGTLIRNNIEAHRYIGKADRMERMITVEAVGESIVKPDIAMATLGMLNSAPTVTEAQEKNTQIMNTLVSRLKDMGIAEADIETVDYSVYPSYDYTEAEGSVLRGYDISQNVRVKIRNIESANTVLGLAGELGLTNVGGLTFTVDNKDEYLEAARKDAVEKLREKIQQVSGLIGVSPVSVLSYDEYEEVDSSIYPMRSYDMMEVGSSESAPQLEPGSENIRLRVRVTIEIR